MDYRHLARLLAAARVAMGVGLLAFPRRIVDLWTGPSGPGGSVLGRALGVRDLVLGLGTIRALSEDNEPELWVRYGVTSDLVDSAATVMAFRGLPKGRRLLGVVTAASAAAVGALALARLDDISPGRRVEAAPGIEPG